MQDNHRDIFNERAEDAEFFNSSPGYSAMNKLALAGDNVSGVQTARTIISANADRDKRGKDASAVSAQLALTAEQHYQEAMQSAYASLDTFKDTIAEAQAELDAKNAELDEITITLSDETKVYYDPASKKFEEYSANGEWLALSKDQQAEAHKLWDESGESAGKPDKIAMAEQNSRIVAAPNKEQQSRQELDEVKQAVDSGIMSKADGEKIAADIEENVTAKSDEIIDGMGISFTTYQPDIVKSADVKIESHSIFTSAHSRSDMGFEKPFPNAGNISDNFTMAANGTQAQPNDPIPETNLPTPKMDVYTNGM